MLLRFFHELDHLQVVNHERALVRHKCFERSNAAFFDQVLNFNARLVIKVGDSDVKRVISHGVSIGHLMPMVERVVQGVSLSLNRKIDDGGGSSV